MMYKKSIGILMLQLLALLGILFLTGSSFQNFTFLPLYNMRIDPKLYATDTVASCGTTVIAASGQRVIDYTIMTMPPEPDLVVTVIEPEFTYVLTPEEYDVLLRIVAAEAGGEDEDGQLLVANVIFNRMNSEDFPDTLEEVVFQQSGKVTQFSPVKSGSIWKVKIGERTYAAVDRALRGEDISQGALFFAARKYANDDAMRWFDESLTYLFEHGGHEFFK